MDLFVRIPASNMHDVGIQTMPTDQTLDSSPREERKFGFETDKSGNLEQSSSPTGKGKPSPLHRIPSPNDPLTLTLTTGESSWYMESSTPRPVSKMSPSHSPREKGRVIDEGLDSADRNPAHALSNFQPRMDQLEFGMDYKLHIITSELGVSDWIKGKEHVPLDVGRIKFDSPDLIKSVERDSRSESCASVVSNFSGRSLNEPLDKYMVIRQRTFHGLPRSKKELRVLPLTDPRENNPSTKPSWLYRSKTDLFLEKRRRNKMAAAARRTSYAKARRSWHDLEGMTFAGLMETLPNVNQPSVDDAAETIFVDMNNNQIETGGVVVSHSRRKSLDQEENKTQPKNAHSSKLPPISLKQNHHQQQVKKEDHLKEREDCQRNHSGTSSPSSGGSDSSVENNETQGQSKLLVRQGKLRKQSLAAIPLRLWEPSFDCVVVSSRKVLQPRHLVKTWTDDSPVRHQPSPLK